MDGSFMWVKERTATGDVLVTILVTTKGNAPFLIKKKEANIIISCNCRDGKDTFQTNTLFKQDVVLIPRYLY